MVLKKETAKGLAKQVFDWVDEKKLFPNVRITQHKNSLEFRYKYWKSLEPHLEAELKEKFGFKNNWIEDNEGWTREYYELKTTANDEK